MLPNSQLPTGELSCNKVIASLTFLADGEFGSADTRRIESHLASCAPCALAWRNTQLAERALVEAREAIPAAGDLKPGFTARIIPAPRHSRTLPRFTLAPVGILFVAGMAWLLWPRTDAHLSKTHSYEGVAQGRQATIPATRTRPMVAAAVPRYKAKPRVTVNSSLSANLAGTAVQHHTLRRRSTNLEVAVNVPSTQLDPLQAVTTTNAIQKPVVMPNRMSVEGVINKKSVANALKFAGVAHQEISGGSTLALSNSAELTLGGDGLARNSAALAAAVSPKRSTQLLSSKASAAEANTVVAYGAIHPRQYDGATTDSGINLHVIDPTRHLNARLVIPPRRANQLSISGVAPATRTGSSGNP